MQLEPADLGCLHDMIAYAEEAIAFLGDRDAETLREDRRTLLAVCCCVEIVGEAGWRVSALVKEANPSIPWSLIAGMRHRLAHDYGRVDPLIVHRVVTHDLLALIEALRALEGAV